MENQCVCVCVCVVHGGCDNYKGLVQCQLKKLSFFCSNTHLRQCKIYFKYLFLKQNGLF